MIWGYHYFRKHPFQYKAPKKVTQLFQYKATPGVAFIFQFPIYLGPGV